MIRATMKVYWVLMCCLLYALISCGGTESEDGTAPQKPPQPGQTDNGFNYLFKENTGSYEIYRIPAIVKAKTGTVLAFAEARKKRSNGDSGDIDMVLKRSGDGGKTWGSLITIWNDGLNTCGNPVPIVDQVSGRIHLLMTWNQGEDKWGVLVKGTGVDTRRPYYTYSDDDGKTWAAPVEITASVKNANWDWYATGPVHGIQMQAGAHKGRLVAPCYYTIRTGGGLYPVLPCDLFG